jgi:hypothetical protein
MVERWHLFARRVYKDVGRVGRCDLLGRRSSVAIAGEKALVCVCVGVGLLGVGGAGGGEGFVHISCWIAGSCLHSKQLFRCDSMPPKKERKKVSRQRQRKNNIQLTHVPAQRRRLNRRTRRSRRARHPLRMPHWGVTKLSESCRGIRSCRQPSSACFPSCHLRSWTK